MEGHLKTRLQADGDRGRRREGRRGEESDQV
jgi:hypothetical protein